MARPEVVAGLDMGSGRVACVVGTADPQTGGVTVLAGSSVPCRGIKGGVVINIPEAARAVSKAVEAAEEAAGKEVYGVTLGVRGAHLRSFNNRGAYQIARSDRQITSEDVAAVIQNAKAVPLSPDVEFLHVIPQGFGLDSQRGVPNPEGMEASLLEVEVHVVTASSSHLNNLSKAVGAAGFEVIEPIYGLLAAAELLVTPEEKEIGALLVDFGGETVSLGIFAEGSIKFSKDLPVGSDFITWDLARGLRTSVTTAERLKLEHGLAHPRLLDGDTEISFSGVDGRVSHTVRTSSMMNIIVPRVEQIFSVVGDEVAASNFADLALPGAVLTGGGSQLRGLPEAVGQILNMDVRLGVPHAHPRLAGAPPHLLTPAYATALGLLLCPHGSLGGGGPGSSPRRPAWVRKLKALAEELF